MRPFDQLQQAEMRAMFRRMYHDIGLNESLTVLQEILITAELLTEVITEEMENESQSS